MEVGVVEWRIAHGGELISRVDKYLIWGQFVPMRIIAEETIRQWAGEHARAAASLRQWVKVVRPVRWGSFAEMRRTFPAADLVTVKSGRKVAVFNVGGNEFRLMCAVHFNTGMVFALRFLPHAEYSKNTWKNEL
jgi:mRNA interferase HigB